MGNGACVTRGTEVRDAKVALKLFIYFYFRTATSVITNAVSMDSNVGLDYIVGNPDYCNKLASGKIKLARSYLS